MVNDFFFSFEQNSGELLITGGRNKSEIEKHGWLPLTKYLGFFFILLK